MSEITIQRIYDGLRGDNYVAYLYAITEGLREILEVYDPLCWHVLNEENLDMLAESLGWNTMDVIRRSRDIDLNDEYVRVGVYGDLESISRSGLRELYEEMLFNDEDYLHIVEELLEVIVLW